MLPAPGAAAGCFSAARRAWRSARRAAMESWKRVGGGLCPPGMCERCFAAGRLRPADTVHHVRMLTPDNIDDPSVSLDQDNLMRLCRDCHAEVHAGLHERAFEPRVAFDERGRVVPLDG